MKKMLEIHKNLKTCSVHYRFFTSGSYGFYSQLCIENLRKTCHPSKHHILRQTLSESRVPSV